MSSGRTAAAGNATNAASAVNRSTSAPGAAANNRGTPATSSSTNLRNNPAATPSNNQETPASAPAANNRNTPATNRSAPATNRNASGSASGTPLTTVTPAQIHPQPLVSALPVSSTTFNNLDTITELILISDRGTYDKLLIAIGRKHLLIEFYAPWCGACMLINNKLEELAVTYTGKLVIAKVNIDDCEQIAIENNVSMMPSFVLFKENQVLEKFAGSSEEKLMSTIKKHVGDPPNNVTSDEQSQPQASTTPAT